ncbi:hypothetical protein COOONC_20028, partial [Cooperia oncophora]
FVKVWNRRVQLRKPILQRDEVISPKVYYAPEWELDKKPNKDAGYPDPLKGYGMTPEKWEYYNKVVWPPIMLYRRQDCQKPEKYSIAENRLVFFSFFADF